MNEILAFLSRNPAYAAVAVVLALVGAYSLFKKLLKTAIVAGVIFFAYCFYLHSEGKALPTPADAERVLQQGKQMGDRLERQAQQTAKDLQQAAKNTQEAKSKVDEARAKLGDK